MSVYRDLNNRFFKKLGFELTLEGVKFLEEPREVQRKLARIVNPKPDWLIHSRYFAFSLEEIDPEKISPTLKVVETKEDVRIFRHAMSFWSVPVSAGYGRRVRFIVWDICHGKVIGIFGLCDPIIGLEVRDRFIGWDVKIKNKKLYNLMTAYVLGAVYPYNLLLGGKLIALICTSSEVRKVVENRYGTLLSAIDTMGAFGKSAIYTRLRGWKFVGYTKGYTHYHLSCNGFFEFCKDLLRKTGHEDILQSYRFGEGPNWKFRVLKEALKILGLDPRKTLNLGIKRGYYFCPLAENWKDFLCGETDMLMLNVIEYPMEEQIRYWKKRWLVKRLSKLEELLLLEKENRMSYPRQLARQLAIF